MVKVVEETVVEVALAPASEVELLAEPLTMMLLEQGQMVAG